MGSFLLLAKQASSKILSEKKNASEINLAIDQSLQILHRSERKSNLKTINKIKTKIRTFFYE